MNDQFKEMITDKHIMFFMILAFFVGIVLNVWTFMVSDDHSSDDFN